MQAAAVPSRVLSLRVIVSGHSRGRVTSGFGAIATSWQRDASETGAGRFLWEFSTHPIHDLT